MKLSKFLLLLMLVASFGALVCVRADDDAVAEAETDAAGDDADAVVQVGAGDMTEDQKKELEAGKETHGFQAEVNRLMDIIINSLYSNRDIFLRELISNASDALDKIRYMSLTDESMLGEGDTAKLEILVAFDKEARTLTLRDRGVGMTKDMLIKNLGVVASSGTTQFVEAAASGEADPLSLIGQFGVGFYSVYLVADTVTVTSKNNDDDQYIWESTANSDFTVAKDPRGNTLGRGTEITLHLKEEADEYLDKPTLERIIGRYSEFIMFPILLDTTKEIEVEEEIVPEEKSDEDKSEDDDLEVKDEDDKPKTKMVKKTVQDWKRLNNVQAIWTRNPSDVTEDEYNKFYEDLTKDTNGVRAKIHFKAEGEISFKSILYVPHTASKTHYDKYYEKSNALKLYVRKVLISDEFEDFLPRYLNMVQGVVDSDDLPLNVSRETLAQSRVLKVMGKKLTRKAMEMLRKLSEQADADAEEEEEEENAEKEADADGEEKEKEEKEEKEDPYLGFWENYGKSIKLGIVEDSVNRVKLSKLLRFITNKSEDKPISLQDYVDDMDESQKYIYYITGETLDNVKASPFLEQLEARGFEVLYLIDSLDEYVVQNLSEFDGKKLMSATKEGLKFGDEGVRTKNKAKMLKEEFQPFTDWLKSQLDDKVEKVIVSNRLSRSPSILVTGQYGWTANMERIMKGQTMADASSQQHMISKKTLEINPKHVLIQALKTKFEENADDELNREQANLLHDAALLRSGFSMDDPDAFARRIHKVLGAHFDVDIDAEIEIDPNPEDDEQYDDPEPEPEEEEAAPIDLDAEDASADDAEEPAPEDKEL